jgi:hypothetical protein
VRSTLRGSFEQHLPWPEPREDEQVAPEVWKCRLPTSGEVVALVRTEADASRLCPNMLTFTLAEAAVAIEALGEVALEAKRAFPGATVTAVRNRGEETTGQPIAKNRDTKRTPNIRRAKPLPPAGSYQSLAKKMPKDTRYKGESYPASNVKARYEEHMATQRAATAAVQSRGDRG